MYVIDGLDRVEGYPPGCFGILSKVHHAAVDGASGTDIGVATQDLTPDAPPPLPPVEPWRGEPEPSPAELLARAGWNAATQPWRFLETWTTTDMANRLRQAAAAQSAAPPPAQVPRTRFNAAVSAHRVVDAVTFELDDVRAMRSITPGSTVNDVVLAIVGGALRDYLSDKNELPDLSLTAMCPISLRSETDRTPGNQVGAMFVPLHTNIGDAHARLHAVHASTGAAKELQNAVGARTLTDLSKFIPAATAALAGRMAATQAIANENVRPAVQHGGHQRARSSSAAVHGRRPHGGVLRVRHGARQHGPHECGRQLHRAPVREHRRRSRHDARPSLLRRLHPTPAR